jgi:hypothetical protein
MFGSRMFSPLVIIARKWYNVLYFEIMETLGDQDVKENYH